MSYKKNTTEQIKKQLIEALEKTLGVVTTACKMVGCGRTIFYEYYNTDPEFRKEVDSISGITLDFAESQLHKKIKEGDTTSIIFFLKTKGKSRGYIERTEQDINLNGTTVIDWKNDNIKTDPEATGSQDISGQE